MEVDRDGRRVGEQGQRRAAPMGAAGAYSFDGGSPEHLRKADGFMDLTIDPTLEVG